MKDKRLKIQKWLKANIKDGLPDFDKLKDEWGIKTNVYDDRLVFNYSIIGSAGKSKNDKMLMECRGLILHYPDTDKVMSRSFDRFFNYNEDSKTKYYKIEKAIIYEKVDGCVHKDEIVDTKEYGKKTIKEIVDKKVECHVKSFDINKNKIVWKKIQNWSVKSESNNWFEIELCNGIKIKLTENHKVWSKTRLQWVAIKDLFTGEEVLMKK